MSNVTTPGPDAMQFVAAGEAYAINAGGSLLTRPETNYYSQMFATLAAGHQHLLHYKDPDTGTLRARQWNNLLAPGNDYTITKFLAMNDHHLATATVIHNPSGQTKQVLLVPMDIIAHRRGTVNAPGAKVPKGTGTGEYGYETVMMENADSESAEDSTVPDYSLQENLNAYRMVNDDDLVKIVLHYYGPQANGVSLELQHEGTAVDARIKASEMENPQTAIEVLNTGSRMKFYDAYGNLLDNETDLKINDLGNPGDGYLSQILDPANNGQLILFIEGGNKFAFPFEKDLAFLDENPKDKNDDNYMQKLGVARFRWVFSQGKQTTEVPLLVYRGGILVFKQKKNKPGTKGYLEFWDGKGRLRHKSVGDNYRESNTEDDTDCGEKIDSWTARSGLTTGNADYTISGENGHTPPGWWFAVKNPSEVISLFTVKKGKKSLRYKFRLFPIYPATRYKRSGLLIHPDGSITGTKGCIGIVGYDQSLEVKTTLENYNGLKLKISGE